MPVDKIIARALTEGRNLLFEDEASALLRTAGIPVNPCLVAPDEDEAVRAAQEIGFPVVLKVRSPAVIHKTDVGGVRLGLTDAEAVRLASRIILGRVRNLDAQAQLTVQPMAPPSVELLIGMTTDFQFGRIIAFGLGGTLVELIKDITFRLVPLQEEDAADMLNSIKSSAVLNGYRGSRPLDAAGIIDVILKVSQLAGTTPSIKEIDLNPVLAYPTGVLAVDARIIIE